MKFYQTKNFQYFLTFAFIIVSFQFCNYVGMSNELKKFPQFLSIPLMFLACWKPIFLIKSPNTIFCNMRWIVFSLIISIISAWVFWGQSLSLGFRSTSTMFTILFFFYLYKIRPSVDFLEKIIWTIGFVYIILWLYAFSQAPMLVFGNRIDEETGMMNEDLSRGMLRLSFTGIIFLILSFFLSLNKFYCTHKKTFLVAACIFFLFIVFQLTRQLILWSVFTGLIYIYLKNPKRILGIGIVCFFIFTLFVNVKISDKTIIGRMLNITQEQIDSNKGNEEDIRITEYKYFFGEWSKNIITDIIGNGKPHSASHYGRYYESLQTQQKLFLSDVGYAEMFVIQGLLGLCFYLFLFFKSVRLQMPADLDYARMFMFFMIPANITADWFAKPDCQIALSICVYLIMRYGRKSKGKILATPDSTYC